jgi:uncharacterized protein (DUF2147 family)
MLPRDSAKEIRVRSTIAALALLALALPASAQRGGSIAGRWRTDDGKAVITVAPCSAGATTMCGRISRFLVAEPAGGARDGNNPDRALRTRPLMGVQILSNLTREGNSWTGRGYSPEEGRNFNATVRVENGRLNVRGCVAVFCRTVVWTRA